MITEDLLRRDVLEYLRTNYSIKLDIPVFKKHYSDTISLRLFRSPLGQSNHENRYVLLIRESEELLRKNIINTDKIKEFGEHFFETVTQDILVLQGNEQIRRGFSRMRDQISYRVESLASQQKAIEEECKSINDKEQVLTFLQGNFRTYLAQIRQISQQYEAVNNVQVLTSINIDSLYSERLGNEEDYFQHYQPLLQVMQRLKSNMIKLYQQLNRCEYFQLPLKSVNFLANCKNLLIELEPFLIKNDCVFNRLIFYVVRGQKENNRFIGRVFQANTAFSNDVICDIFKAFFLSHIFMDHYRALKAKIQQERQQLIKHFETASANSENFYGQKLRTEKRLQQAKGELEQIKRVVGMGKDKIMRSYLGRKQCKKLKLLIDLEHSSTEIIKFAKNMLGVLQFKTKIQTTKEKVDQAERHIRYTETAIKQQEALNLKPTHANIKEMNEKIDQRFQQSYLLIQQGLLELTRVRQSMQQITDQSSESYFNKEFFPNMEKGLQELHQRYLDLETDLLNSYQGLRKQKLAKTGEARSESQAVIEELSEYFETKVTGEMGYDIRNEDSQCEEVKDNIIKVEKVEFLLNSYLTGHNTDEWTQLQDYKTNLQCLLQVYQGSMDEKIFENFMERLNFEAEDWPQRASKVKELIRELTRYIATLKKGLLSHGKKYFPKVTKLVKNRTQLYQVIKDMYEQFLLIYQTCKTNSHLNPSDHGLKLFDEASYKYVLMLYQYRNRTRAQTEELKDMLLPKRTLNYLLDDIYEPFLQIFGHYVSYSEQQLLSFTLRLQHALNFQLSQGKIVQLYEQTLAKPYHAEFFATVKKLSEELVQLGEQNKKVLHLQEQEVVIYNLNTFKQRAVAIQQHVMLAEAVLRGLRQSNLRLEVELQNKTLMILRQKVIGDWQDHREDYERSINVSRLEDFSNNDQ